MFWSDFADEFEGTDLLHGAAKIINLHLSFQVSNFDKLTLNILFEYLFIYKYNYIVFIYYNIIIIYNNIIYEYFVLEGRKLFDDIHVSI